MRKRRARETVVRLTLAEAIAIANATGFRGSEPTAAKDMAALDRALSKIDHATERFRRLRRRDQ